MGPTHQQKKSKARGLYKVDRRIELLFAENSALKKELRRLQTQTTALHQCQATLGAALRETLQLLRDVLTPPQKKIPTPPNKTPERSKKPIIP